MPMTPEAKSALSKTIRNLRTRLLEDLHASTETAYRLSVRARDAGLSEAAHAKRMRLGAWLDEQVRADSGNGRTQRTRDDFRREVEKQAAYTLLNRIIILRLMETMGLRSPAVVTGGWESPAYKDFRSLAPALVRGDESEGYAFLLQMVFEDLAIDLPGLYGSAGVADLVPVGAATLRHVVETLDAPALKSCWTDDMTLGWVYQYWNDPEREALDAKLNAGGKVEPHEIASKTQMFTERYMVDWLLQNSLGPLWLAMCRKHGWTADCERGIPAENTSDPALGFVPQPNLQAEPERVGTAYPPTDANAGDPASAAFPLTGLLKILDGRRADWRTKRERGEVSLTALMPLHSEAERRWAYYVPQPIPTDAVQHAPKSVRDLKLLDPAVGSGHFLVVAFDLLFALYQEEARHRGESGEERWSDRAIVERILEHNLHGIDLDPRAVQIAAAALWLKARRTCPDAHPARLNLVASNLRLASLPDDDPALMDLRREVEREAGLPAALTDTVIHALKGADHLGSLLKVDAAVEEAIDKHEVALGRQEPKQFSLLEEETHATPPRRNGLGDGASERSADAPLREAISPRDLAKAGILDRLENFLAHHTSGNDLGLRLRGEQLAAGVRFVRMIREGTYDLVVGNPPYQGTSKMADAAYVKRHYPRGKADLYAAFLERGLQLVREGGTSALLTMRNWMFIKQYVKLRTWLLQTYDLRALGDFAIGAFDEVPNDVLSVVVSVFRKAEPAPEQSVALQPTPLDDRSYDRKRTRRKRAAVMCHVGRYNFDSAALQIVPDWPLVYWWHEDWVGKYTKAPKLAEVAPVRATQGLYNNVRFTRCWYEVAIARIHLVPQPSDVGGLWVPFTNGADGAVWVEPLRLIVAWIPNGLMAKLFMSGRVQSDVYQYANEHWFFQPGGIAFSMIGASFSARYVRYTGTFGDKGRCLFPPNPGKTVCLLNSRVSRYTMTDLNPSMSFQAGDVNRLPWLPDSTSESIWGIVQGATATNESHREPSVEFKHPGPSPWRHAQAWAQTAVDRPEDAPLPHYEPEYDSEPPTDHLSFALGVALGRFGPNGEGILDPTKDNISHALSDGILFLDGTLDPNDHRDGLGHPEAQGLHSAWSEYGAAIDARTDLRTWLRLKFFRDVHKGMYGNRPIHWPLTSEKKTFAVWINIHRWDERTLRVLLADHLNPALVRIEGELNDLRAARDGVDRKAAREAEKRFDRVKRWRDELAEFITMVEQCAEKGPPPVDAKCSPRGLDARYAPDLDDGVMINSAALWPLLVPQWRDPKKWWKELATASGKKDYDWSHLAMRYWPTRVDEKCREDPSLGVAHGCFWKYHPARAWAWELRLQDEIGPEFRIEEVPYRGDGGHEAHRAAYLEEHADDALAAIKKEVLRRRRKQKQPQPELRLLEPGLWTRNPDQCWQLELDLTEKQQIEFRLLAPDEPEARAAFEHDHPELVQQRRQLIASLSPPEDLFAGTAAEEDTPGESDTTEKALGQTS